MSIAITRSGAVTCHATLEIPLAAVSVWGQIRDFYRYASQDFFHADIAIAGGVPRAGARLSMSHRYAGFHVMRVGRILVWREGVGYSFSDLSTRGPRSGFPHVFSYRIEPRGKKASRLHITVRGLWTARWMPRWAAKLWLRWVFAHTVRSVGNRVAVYELWRRDPHQHSRGQPRPPGPP